MQRLEGNAVVYSTGEGDEVDENDMAPDEESVCFLSVFSCYSHSYCLLKSTWRGLYCSELGISQLDVRIIPSCQIGIAHQQQCDEIHKGCQG